MITITETDNIFSFGTRFKIVLAHISICVTVSTIPTNYRSNLRYSAASVSESNSFGVAFTSEISHRRQRRCQRGVGAEDGAEAGHLEDLAHIVLQVGKHHSAALGLELFGRR